MGRYVTQEERVMIFDSWFDSVDTARMTANPYNVHYHSSDCGYWHEQDVTECDCGAFD